MRLALPILLLLADAARADCTFQNGTYSEPRKYGVCRAAVSVPAGCPVPFVIPNGQPPPEIIVLRGSDTIDLPVTTTLVETTDALVANKDVLSCTCDAIQDPVPFDRVEATIAGLAEGDGVLFSASPSADEVGVEITAAAPCPPTEWPTLFRQFTACDLCPTEPPGDGDEDDGASCTASSGAGWLAMVLVVMAVPLRRRYHRAR